MLQRPVIVWFRNDLRLHDNEALYKAAQKTPYVVPVYCIDPRQFGITTYSLQKTGRHRTRFLLESLADLRLSLQKIGSNLLVRLGRPEEVLPQLAQELHATDLYYNRLIAHEEMDVEEALQQNLEGTQVRLHPFWSAALLHPADLPFAMADMPGTFQEFRPLVAGTKVRMPLPAPQRLAAVSSLKEGEIPTLAKLGFPEKAADERALIVFKGGETEALIRLKDFIWNRDLVSCCKGTRNAMLGADYSSKFSPWLANGSLSARRVYQQLREYEEERVANESTAWLHQELLGRDFFRFLAHKYGTRLFQEEGIKGRDKHQPEDFQKFSRWKKGKTGIPFIDAAMQELNATGFLSFKARQNVASFLVNDLKVNWLMGAEYFESRLIDYDVASNYGNWNYVAGVGNDPRPDRHLNVQEQAALLDPNGAYVKHWLPQLANLPTDKVHQPWLLNDFEQERFGVKLGEDYPLPVVELVG